MRQAKNFFQSKRVINYLTDSFGVNLICRHGHVRWSPRSSDLTPCDNFLLVTYNFVYKRQANN